MRQPNPLVSTFDSHELEVSGLEWSPDGKFLASGGNDNIVNIWTNDVGASGATPLRQLTDHQAGVKALSWCPWKPQVLASGGGSACRKMMIWNCANGTKLLEVDTENQISGIHWNQHHKLGFKRKNSKNFKIIKSECAISHFRIWRQKIGSQMKAHDPLILKMAFDLISIRNFSRYRNLKI